MSPLESALTAALVDAAFWVEVGQPQRVDSGLVLCLSHQLHQRLGNGHARTIRKPSKLNKS